MKTCTICHLEKPDSEFYAKYRRCKTCVLATQAAYRQKVKARAKTIPETKLCPACRHAKPASEYHRNAARPDGLLAYCKACWAARARAERYGIEPATYLAMLERQGRACKICDRALPLVVDHCHGSGEVRGLLCSPCNTGIGQFGDSVERLRAAIAYLSAVSGQRRAEPPRGGGRRGARRDLGRVVVP